MIQTPPTTAPVSTAGRLKYADPRDLPSYPSPGLRPDGAAASAAASLGWSNKKTIEPWKPNKTSSASAAAALAKDYKMAAPWEPASNTVGQRAALLAASSTNVSTPPPPKNTHEGWGNSAATQAFNTNRSNSVRQPPSTTSNTAIQRQKSVAAAQGAMATTRRRAQSTPSAPVEEQPIVEPGPRTHALSGATLAHRASLKPKAAPNNAGAVPVTTMTRNMFTSNPPVKPEVDEQENNEKLRATAVAMARKMFLQQQKLIDEAKETQGQETNVAQPKPYINLQDAAYKQAQERLAKIENEHQKSREMQSYYGNQPSSPSRNRFSLTSKLRRRSSSEGDISDRQQSEKIRQQMSLFSNKLSEVDEKKRQQDRDALLAIAQRNVKTRLQGMDQKVYNETGQVNPTMMSEWEIKAQQIANASHETRTQNKGKIDIGGGRFMEPHEIDAIAAKRMQPVLDDINEKAEMERQRLAVLKAEEEARKTELEKQKARDREIKDIHHKLKEQEKQEYKAKKAEEKAARAEEKRLAKEAERKSKAANAAPASDAAATTAAADVVDESSSNSEDEEFHDAPRSREQPTTSPLETNTSAAENEQTRGSESPISPTSKVKGWIKNRFSRGKSVGEKDNERHSEKRKSFIGGAALRGSDGNHSTTSFENRPSSMRDVALAGRSKDTEADDQDIHDSRGVSPVSTLEDRVTSDTRDVAITPPPVIEDPAKSRNSQSPTRDSRFRENLDQ